MRSPPPPKSTTPSPPRTGPPPRPHPPPKAATPFARLLGLQAADRDPPPATSSRPRARPETIESATGPAAPELLSRPPSVAVEPLADARPLHEPPAAAPAGELQRVADEMIRAARVVELPSEIALFLELEVPLLRRVGVELRLSDGRLRACLRAADRAGLDRLRAGVPELEAALEARGIAADRVEVIARKA